MVEIILSPKSRFSTHVESLLSSIYNWFNIIGCQPRPVQTCRATEIISRLRKQASREMNGRFRGRAGRGTAPHRPRKNLLAAASRFSVSRTRAPHEHGRRARGKPTPRRPSTTPATPPKRGGTARMALQKQPKAYTQNGRRFAYTFESDFVVSDGLLYGARLLSSAIQTPKKGTRSSTENEPNYW